MLETQLLDGVEAILGSDGMLVRSGAGHFNQNQYNYAVQVVRGFCRFRESDSAASVNLQQAATGTGKTIGYLVPALLHAAYTGSRVVVSTYTRHLQHQILTGDAPRVAQWVSELTGKQLQVCRRVGRQNYLSRMACRDFLAQLEQESTDKECVKDALRFMRQLCQWLDETTAPTPLLDDFLYGEDADLNRLPAGIERSQLCISSTSPEEEINGYHVDVERTQAADVVITNHALTMLNAFRWASILDGLRGTDLLICDEADRLTDAAESVMGADLSLHRLVRLAEMVAETLNRPEIVVPIQVLSEAVLAVNNGGRQLALMPPEVKQKATSALSIAIPSALAFSGALTSKQLSFESADAELMADFIDSVADLQRLCASAEDQSNTCLISWSPVRHYPSLRIGQPNPARVITRMLAPRNWDEKMENGELLPPRSYLKSCLFTSATLATPGKTLPAAFDAFASTVGIIRHCAKGQSQPIHNVCVDLYRNFEPRIFGQMSFVLADPQVHSPTLQEGASEDRATSTSPEWLDYCADMIRAAVENKSSPQERTLVLTLSFFDTDALVDRLNDLPNLIVHRKGEPISAVLARYKETPGAVMLTPAGWEGIDLPGMVNNLVITRIPNSPPDSFRSTLNEVVLREKGFSEDKISQIVFGMMFDATRRKLAQGLGRGIRHPDDKVCVWIADPRFPFPESFMGSLDEVLMKPRRYPQKIALQACIPVRFMSSFNQAKLFLAETRTVYAPEDF
ncbi:ATP-dependent DNA helicase [Azotobacter chroococcum]|uniref:ATP-dependent DNA helicase n=1 Tax=Azotobacter chroococcum TaxID=353 RepID=UPI0010AECA9C|nr:ATP-dependent DNA helicase [Azotobacter chroococcum]TKD35294.1 ATP-dependent DNA helicase [Azotobacter chroococcum]